MLFVIEGPSSPEQLEHAFGAIVRFWSENGVTSVAGLHVNGFVWADDARLQVKDGEEVTQVNVLRRGDGNWAIQPSGIIQPRDDRPFNPLALLFNHDD